MSDASTEESDAVDDMAGHDDDDDDDVEDDEGVRACTVYFFVCI